MQFLGQFGTVHGAQAGIENLWFVNVVWFAPIGDRPQPGLFLPYRLVTVPASTPPSDPPLPPPAPAFPPPAAPPAAPASPAPAAPPPDPAPPAGEADPEAPP
jgi:hypothetical protein